MNRNRISLKMFGNYCGAIAMTLGLLFALQSCNEKIDDDNYAIATDKTIYQYLSTDTARYSNIKSIFDRVRLGRKENASVLASVLSARGNYTVFIPSNKAMAEYVTSLLGPGKTVNDLSKEQAEIIAYSCVIDNGSDGAFESPDFPIDGGAFIKGDLNDRTITCKEVVDSSSSTATTYYLINGKSKIVKSDVKLSNGYLHEVDVVIAPSNQNVPDLIKNAPNMRIMGMLLDETGWASLLSGTHMDMQYEGEEREQIWRLANVNPFNVAQHRYLCYTGFVETDDVFVRNGVPAPQYDKSSQKITNAREILAKITEIAEKVYGTDEQSDLKNEKNAVNRFVAYHFVKGRMAHNQFVQHFNEWGYKYGDMKNPQQKTYSVDVWDYFATVGNSISRGLLKVTQDYADHNIYLNRVCTYDGSDNYKQTSVVRRGIQVLPTNEVNGVIYDNSAKNGNFFPIDGLLMLDKETAKALGSERIRFDLTTILPELLSYGCRSEKKYTYFPKLRTTRADGTTGYFENILNESEDTRLLYLHSAHVGASNWRDYQGDEFMVAGIYDFVLRLPPVPQEGQYEIRMGLSNNSLRGMCQIYFGTNPTNLLPAGLPVDMRQPQSENDNIGWFADGTSDAATIAEKEKNMRNHGYMKSPKYFTLTDGKGDTDGRNSLIGAYSPIRRIITTTYMKPGVTYYIRFKSALNKSDAQFFSDYLEFVPREVYNGTTPEDIW